MGSCGLLNVSEQKLVSPPILAYPQFDVPFVVQTDTSAHAVGGVLNHVQDGKECVIAYWSQQLKKAKRNYSTIEREALVVVGAIKGILSIPLWIPIPVVH